MRHRATSARRVARHPAARPPRDRLPLTVRFVTDLEGRASAPPTYLSPAKTWLRWPHRKRPRAESECSEHDVEQPYAWTSFNSGLIGANMASAAVFDPRDPKTAHAAAGDRIWRSDDRGATWTEQGTLPFGTVGEVFPYSSEAGRWRCELVCRALLATRPSTRSSGARRTPTCCSQARTKGSPSMSGDGGDTWTDISRNPGTLRVFQLEYDEEVRALYAFTEQGVYRRQQDGAFVGVDTHCLKTARSGALLSSRTAIFAN